MFRRWSLRALTLLALLMALDQAQSLAGRFASARRLVNVWRLAPQAVGATYQGLVKAMRRASPRLLRAIGAHLRQQIPVVAGQHWQVGPWVLIGADGSKFNLPRTQGLVHAFGASGKRGGGPQAYLTTLLHLSTGLPWDAWIGRGRASERAHVRRRLARLPAATLLVADAGFVGYALWAQLQQQGLHFLIRVGANVRLLVRLGYGVRAFDDLVYLWPDQDRKAGRPPLVLRRIRLHDGRKEVCLVTNVLDPQQLDATQASRCYRLRWGIELWYRQLKQTAARRQLASHAPEQATLELAWLVVAMAVLGLMGVRDAIRRGHDPLALSPAAILGVLRVLSVRPELRGGLRTLRRSLARCVKDRYVRKAAKVRVRWAVKKREHPAGVPRITDATPTQVAAAASVLSLTLLYNGRSWRRWCRRPWSRRTGSARHCSGPGSP